MDYIGKYKIKKLQKGAKVGEELQDFGSRMLHGLQTFGGSYIGDAIQGASPKAAGVVSKYTSGLISPTPQDYLNRNRSSWKNRASSAMNATSTILAGEVAGPVLGALGKGIMKGKPIASEAFKVGKAGAENINVRLGKSLDMKLGKYPNRSKIIQNANAELRTGLGIKNKNVAVQLDDLGYGETRTLLDNMPTGELDMIVSHKPRGITDIIRGRKAIAKEGFEGATKPGVSINRNYPYSGTARGSKGMPQPTEAETMDFLYNSEAIETFNKEMFEGLGINGEMIQAIKKGANKEGQSMFMGGQSSPDSVAKYAKDVAAGRAKLISKPGTEETRRIFEYRQKGGKINWIQKNKYIKHG